MTEIFGQGQKTTTKKVSNKAEKIEKFIESEVDKFENFFDELK